LIVSILLIKKHAGGNVMARERRRTRLSCWNVKQILNRSTRWFCN